MIAAKSLEKYCGKWQIPWGELHRLQRAVHAPSPQAAAFGLSDNRPSYPCLGSPGPLGQALTDCCSPDDEKLPFKKRYGVVGALYVAAYQFGDRVKVKSLLQFGVSGNPDSPHFFDQAKLLSEQKYKDDCYCEDGVKANTVKTYHPGEE